jgi:hypothetical protein
MFICINAPFLTQLVLKYTSIRVVSGPPEKFGLDEPKADNIMSLGWVVTVWVRSLTFNRRYTK